MKPEKTFVDFILDIQKGKLQAKGFLEAESPQELEAFFKENGYTVDRQECEKLIKAKEDFPPMPDELVKY